MKLDQFITSVLVDIDNGIHQAAAKTNRKYYVEISGNKGVNFDVAVTTVSSDTNSAEGTAKAGFVEVLGAGVGAKLENKKENSEVSRIQFAIHVPIQTEEESNESTRQLQAAGNGEVWGI